MKSALTIFVKNLQFGKVKTRLAASVGTDKAFEIYEILLKHTYNLVKELECDKFIFYSDFIEESDSFSDINCRKAIQNGDDLGKRMLNAFSFLFEEKYDKVVIIGSDCIELSGDIIKDAFNKLSEADVVIGPASDGGYYLLGLNNLDTKIFENILWSTPNVLKQTLEVCEKESLSYQLLPVLSDIDTEEDWKKFNMQHATSTNEKDAIIFVHNAESNLFSKVTDYVHKIFSPATYSCTLCKLTFHNFGMKQEWRSFTDTLPFGKEFLYQDEFVKKYHTQDTFPAIYHKSNNELKLLISSKEITSVISLEELKSLVKQKLEEHVQYHHSHI